MAVLISIIACKTGLIFALLTRYSFGSTGSKAASIFVPVVNLGWYTIQAATYGHFVAQVFHMGQVGEGICMAVSAIVMGIFAMCGIGAITILGYIAIPAIVFLSIATAIRSLGVIGGMEALFAYVPSSDMPLFTGITAVIGTWVLSTATCIADIMRYAKDTKAAVSATLTGLLGGNHPDDCLRRNRSHRHAEQRPDGHPSGIRPGHPKPYPDDNQYIHHQCGKPVLHLPEPFQCIQDGSARKCWQSCWY